MVLAESKTISFDDFVSRLPERSAYRYELHEGEIIEMPKPRGKHSEIAGSIISKLNLIIHQAQLPYIIPRESIVKSIDSRSGYEPNVIVLDQKMLADESRWEAESIITNGSSIKLVVEVVSTNWQDDYAIKQMAYQALGGRTFIGYPKQPVISVYSLIDCEYNLQQFRGNDLIQSSTFPGVELSIDNLVNIH